MSKDFEELDYQSTPIGDICLRRRRLRSLGGIDIFEVKLGDEYLMSSLFHEVEVALSDLALAEVDSPVIDVVVGGLGLGYTAWAALKHPQVHSLLVVELLDAVIGWHQKGLVPLGPHLTADPRSRLVSGDFFALAADHEQGFDLNSPGRRFHAILLDIDHSPEKLLHERHGSFYSREGLQRLSMHLHVGGVFGLWSDDPPHDAFVQRLQEVFVNCQAHVVKFHNPLLNQDSASTVYLAHNHSMLSTSQC